MALPSSLGSPSPFVAGLPRITVLVGHAGTGKTNAAIGIARELAGIGHDVTLADLDVVNPYFRSSDYPAPLAEAGVRLVAPVFAGTTLDTPSLSGRLDAVIASVAGGDDGRRLVMDVGGDADGATALGRYAAALSAAGARVLYVVSAYRDLTRGPAAAAGLLADIETHCHLRASGVLNTSNLGMETTLGEVGAGRRLAAECARMLGLPLEATLVPEAVLAGTDPGRVFSMLMNDGDACEELLVMPKYVLTPWEAPR